MRQSFQFIAKLMVVLVLFAILFSYAMFQGGFVSWFLFYAFLPFLIYMFSLLIYPINNWQVERDFSKRVVTAGETVSVDVTFRRRFPFPLYYCVIEEYLPESLKKREKHLGKFRDMAASTEAEQTRRVNRVVFPWFRTNFRYQYDLEQVPRGEHQLRTLRIKTGDFFGFVKKEAVYRMDHQVLVFPYRRPVQMKEKVSSFEQGASPSFKLKERNTNVVTGVRDYVPGDRFAWVDWKTTAKKNEMMTKEFEQEKSVEMLMILNGVYAPSVSDISFEGAIEFSASLLEELYKNSSQVAFISLGDGRRYFPPYKNSAHKQKVQGHLAQIRAIGQTSFAQQLERERTQIPAGMIVMIVSHYLDADIRQALVKLAQKSKRLIFFYVRPHSQMNFQDHQWIKQLKGSNIDVRVLSEEQFTQERFEVNI